MTTTASTTTVRTTTSKPTVHLRRGVKLGGDDDSAAMLFPTPAFHGAQRQEQKEQGETQEKDHRTRVHHAPREVIHLPEQCEATQQLRLPLRRHRGLLGHECERE